MEAVAWPCRTSLQARFPQHWTGERLFGLAQPCCIDSPLGGRLCLRAATRYSQKWPASTLWADRTVRRALLCRESHRSLVARLHRPGQAESRWLRAVAPHACATEFEDVSLSLTGAPRLRPAGMMDQYEATITALALSRNGVASGFAGSRTASSKTYKRVRPMRTGVISSWTASCWPPSCRHYLLF